MKKMENDKKMRTMTFIDEVNLKFEDDKTYSRDDIMSIILHTLAELSDSDAVRNYALAIAEKYKLKLDNKYDKKTNKLSLKKIVKYLNHNIDYYNLTPIDNELIISFVLQDEKLIFDGSNKRFKYE